MSMSKDKEAIDRLIGVGEELAVGDLVHDLGEEVVRWRSATWTAAWTAARPS